MSDTTNPEHVFALHPAFLLFPLECGVVDGVVIGSQPVMEYGGENISSVCLLSSMDHREVDQAKKTQ